MRRLLIAGAFVAAALLILVAVLALRLNSYLSAHRDQVAAQVSQALGRAVQFTDIGVSWRGGLSGSVQELRVAEDPSFGSGDFLRVERAYVVVRILPALFGNYEIRELQLDAPHMQIVRDLRGFNFDSLGAPSSQTAADRDASSQNERSPGRPDEALALLISVVEVHDGGLTYIDRRTDPSSSFSIDGLEFSASDASLASKIGIELGGRIFGSDEENVKINGTIGPVGASAAIANVPLDLRLNLGPFIIDRLKQHTAFTSIIPAELSSEDPLEAAVTASGTLDSMAGSIELDSTAAGLTYGKTISKPKGTTLRVNGAFQVNDDTVRVDPIAIRIADAELQATVQIDNGKVPSIDAAVRGKRLPVADWDRILASLQGYELTGAVDVDLQVRGKIGGGHQPRQAGAILLHDVALQQSGVALSRLNAKIAVDGDGIDVSRTDFSLNNAPVGLLFTYDIGKKVFRTEVDVRGLDVEPILAAHAPEVGKQVDGELDADLRLTGTASEWPVLRDSLRGSGRLDVKNGVLRNANVVEAVLSSATGIQGLTQLVSASTRRKYPGLLTSADTNFETLGGSFEVADGVVSTNDLRIRAPDYGIDGRGQVRLDNHLDFHAVLRASEQLTEEIVSEVKAAKYLRSSDRQLEIPFRLKGSWPQVRPKPDEKVLLEALGRGALGKGLAELLGGKRKDSGDQRVGETPSSKPKDLLRQGLDELFGR